MVWLGYDSRNSHLPEPPLDKVKQLHWELGRRGYSVILKKIRKAWWKKANSADFGNTLSGGKVSEEFFNSDEK
jgi:hypothetical protein